MSACKHGNKIGKGYDCTICKWGFDTQGVRPTEIPVKESKKVKYVRADLVDNLIDAIENFQCSGGLSIAIKGSIKAIRGEQ